MSYTALYRKWRPDSFEDVKGQDAIVTTIKNQILQGRTGHAYLFCGTRGTGKTTCAKILAKAVNCESPENGNPCCKCPACIGIENGNLMEILEIDAASNNGVDNIRDLREEANFTPANAKYRVYIIDEVHMLSIGAFNALLKTLEEPPSYVIIMLLTANPGSFLQTILSRCLTLEMKPVRNEEIEIFLRNKYEIVDYEARVCAAFSQGNVGKAVNLATSTEFNELKDEVLQLVKRISDIDPYEMSEAVKRAGIYKITIDDYFDLLMVWYRDVLLYKATNDPNLLIFREDVYSIKNAARECSYHGVEEILEALTKAKTRLAANVNFELVMDLLLGVMKENS